jgi:hypothetical protein
MIDFFRRLFSEEFVPQDRGCFRSFPSGEAAKNA